MAEIIGESNWSPVRQLETHELARGGLNGNMNEQAKALVERTNFLKENSATKEDLATVAGGNYGFNTLAEFETFKSSIPANSTVTIAQAGPYQGENIWNGTTLTKSPYDPVSQAKVDATAKANAAEANAKIFMNNLIGRITSTFIPLAGDINRKSPIWINRGRIGFTELDAATKDRVKGQVGLGSIRSKRFIPLAGDINRQCPAWFQDGMINFAAIHPDAVGRIKDQLGSISGGASNNVTKAAYPIISDGASLRQWKAKVSNLKYGIANTQPRLLLTGDSWTDYGQISNRILTTLRTYLGEAGTGWINLGDPKAQFDYVKVERTGTWVFEDLNNTLSFTYSSAPDGYALISSTVDSTLNLENLNKGDQLTVFFGKTDGTFKYSINNGTEVEVTASSSGSTIQMVMIPVGPLNNIVFTVTSGTIAFYGFHLRKSSGSGVEVTKIGNAGATGKDYLKISPAAQANLSDYLKPDAVIIFLGTNDYRIPGNTPETYKNGVSAVIDGYRTNNPNCGIILVAPAKSNGDAVTALSEYRDAVYELAQRKQCEFYNMHDDWDSYSVEKLNEQWADNLHLSHMGSYRLSQKLFKNFFEV
ncbi:SGNH/GDSL hydrolase family protein [Acinetobacter pittii]|uniref:SGNH/GDSL hydrolase family protein n=1 Tax=Acinetobacter pittii TaxID=48296 RepID=UPI002DBFD1C5|nr:GDSL-type esterase/lipase family protein [Acinetobacter pittii]MEB7642633.1 GDSL-type esterase/lipase family protein [Acinetobacter pittii]